MRKPLVRAKHIWRSSKESIVDTMGSVTYPLIVGTALDYASGLRGWGLVASRAYATGINIPTGGLYGKWRNTVFRTTRTIENSGKLKKSIADLVAFNSFQIPLYSSVIAVGSLVSEGEVDWNKVARGAEYLAIFSPLVGPTLGWYMDGLRKAFKLKSAPEKASL